MRRITHCQRMLLFMLFGLVASLLVRASALRGADQATHDADMRIAIEWKGVHPAGQIVVSDGDFGEIAGGARPR